MENKKNTGGRPILTDKQKKEKQEMVLLKLEPYLKSGLSVNKSLQQAKIANSEFYRMMRESEGFWERIERFKQYTSVLANSVLVKHLHYIVAKQSNREQLSQIDIKFLWWFAINNNNTQEEFGKREQVPNFDPQGELLKIKDMIDKEIDENFKINN